MAVVSDRHRLESSNLQNVPFYVRHGFEVTGEIEVARPLQRSPPCGATRADPGRLRRPGESADPSPLWQEAMAVAAAVDRVVQPIKMNYEIHGNTRPHLHLHLFPRQPDDPYVGGPIDPRRAAFTRSENDLDLLAAGMRGAAG